MDAGQWRSIETAPKDGTSIDLWGAERERYVNTRVPDCFWYEGRWVHCRTIHDDESADNPMDVAPIYNVTHWRERPGPPADFVQD